MQYSRGAQQRNPGEKHHLQILAKYRRAMMVHESQLEQQKRVNISRAK